MPKLKNSISSEIISNLNDGNFCREDFNVDFPDDSSALAKLVFLAMPKYQFVIEEQVRADNSLAVALFHQQQAERKKVIRTTESPGDYLNNESHTHDNISAAVDRVSDWVVNIREDLIHSRKAVTTIVDDVTSEFQSSIDEHIENPNEYFQEQEKIDLLAKLEELQKRIETLESEVGLDPQKARQIETAIEKSKADVELYPKGVWYKTAGTKLIKLFKEALKTKEGREIAADIIKRLMS